MNWLVIGYGSPLRGDDKVGHLIASAAVSDDVRAITTQTLTPELAADIGKADGVIFVDACHGDDRGRVRCERVVPHPAAASLSHSLTPEALLYLAGLLYGRWPDARLITVETDAFALGARISRAAARACDEAHAVVLGVLEEWRTRGAEPRP